MEKKETKIAIIGAGISGLIAAQVLEKQGFSPTIYEKTDRTGGRVKTDIMDGYQLDHGFQVLLDAYPMAQKYLNLEALELQRFYPGAIIFKEGEKSVIGDPLRNLSLFIPTLKSGIGTFSDKLKILKLNNKLKKKTIESIFKESERTTLAYLQDFGFSTEIITDFFKPFFSGIFLETELATSSRMFEFVYKMFGSGYATLPKAGIEAIPKQLTAQLKSTRIQYNKEITSCEDGKILFADGSKELVDFIILATEASSLIDNMRNQAISWKSCETLYFTVPKKDDDRPLIGLIPKKDTLINNIFFHTTLATETSGTDDLLSVTVVKAHTLSEYELMNQVKEELKIVCGITEVSYLKTYEIRQALPRLSDLQYSISPSETRLTNSIFLAGDYLLNGSLNAAMMSGEMAAKGLIETAKGTLKL
ncbi:FAD-dependent oxidoreductase [Maribacter sp. 2210JD10-5]|uniref:FAD-dependent oxidoreductase n=1 Tax=Maribacter sp. 2210JD10-5 TaxID=3386272 RepID=UPI0039BD2B58